MKSVSVLFFIAVLLISGEVKSQDHERVLRSNVVETIGGRDYYLHKVERGQTFHAIARAYHVSLESIVKSNYGLGENLQPGQYIKIPVHPGKSEQNKGINLRRVEKGETLYNLSREYNVSVEDIRRANDGLPNGLKEGMLVKIPLADRSGVNNHSGEPQEQEVKRYFEFQEKNRETLYELAIRYRVSIDSIYALNPGIDDQLRKEQIIKIPKTSTGKDFVTHTVRDRNTLNRLARWYNIDIDRLREVNPYTSRHLQVGQVVRIPLPEIEEDKPELIDSLMIAEPELPATTGLETTERERCKNMLDTSEYRIALMLPFYFSDLDSISQIEEKTAEPDFIKPFAFVQFYEGFMLAVDSLTKLGLNADIFVYNVEEDVEQAKQLLQNPELTSMDLIIGPLYSNSFTLIADFAESYQIPIVNPLSTRDEILYDNPYVFKLQPSEDDQFKMLVDVLNKDFARAQIFIARHNPYRETLVFDKLRDVLNRELLTRPLPFTDLYHEIVYTRDSLYTFEHNATPDEDNVVVAYSESKVFVLDILRSLNELRDTFNITVIGMPKWKEIDGLELVQLNNLNTHIFAEDYINYQSEAVRLFVRKFRGKYFTEPIKYGFDGYDTGWYFLSALLKFGDDFLDCIGHYQLDMLNNGFHFEQLEGHGYRNKHWKILEMQNFEFRKKYGTLDEMELIPEKW